MTPSPRIDNGLTGYYPGVIGQLTTLHAVYYHTHWGFDRSFETQVGRELSDFMARFQPQRDGFWAIAPRRTLAGAVAIDGRLRESEGARLRWFIVDPDGRKQGFGRLLLGRAVQFCRAAGCRRVFLWTFEGLQAARRLYEKTGFRLTEEHRLDQWGQQINEQRFDLALG